MPWLPSKLQISTLKNFKYEESGSSRIPEEHIGSWFDALVRTPGSLATHGFHIENAESKVRFEITLDNIERIDSRPEFDIGIKLFSNDKLNDKPKFEYGCRVNGTRLEKHYIGYVFDELTKCGVEIVRNGKIEDSRASLKKIVDKFVYEDEALKKAAIRKDGNIDFAAICCDTLCCCPMIGSFMRTRRSS
jgi:hypothetical protein